MTPTDRLIQRLAATADPVARVRLLEAHPRRRSLETVESLADEIPRRGRVDLAEAERLSDAAAWLAERLDDDYARGRSHRATGHVLALQGHFEDALHRYGQAVDAFERSGRAQDLAITLSGALQPLIYLGRYEEADAWAARARRIFVRAGDRLRLARLDSNAGNIRLRQDRFDEALVLYRRAHRVFQAGDHVADAAVTLRNMAVCYTGLDAFPKALATYRRAREYCERQNLPQLVAEADYNIAYLHFLRGDYERALAFYDSARTACARLGDHYHQALCDLDQSELYFELNLRREGAELAQRALARFQALKVGYESAKAATNLAVAMSQVGDAAGALRLLDQARQQFVTERNRVWPALIDLYKAVLLLRDGRLVDARRLAVDARATFDAVDVGAKAALCDLVIARAAAQAGQPGEADRACRAALDRLRTTGSPALACQAHLVHGELLEAAGHTTEALDAYRASHGHLELLRSRLRTDDLKVALLEDKLAVYESLISLTLGGVPGAAATHDAFALIEQAKSRSLADLIAVGTHSRRDRSPAGTPVGDLRDRRDELSWYYRQIEREEVSARDGKTGRLATLQGRARELEGALARCLLERRVATLAPDAHGSDGLVTVEAIQHACPSGTILLEYYEARGVLHACVIGPSGLVITPLGPAAPVRERVRLLQFQLSKFRLGAAYAERYATALTAAARDHLSALYAALVAPVARWLDGDALVIVPHGFLHHLPFHALEGPAGALIDHFAVSYAPSASVQVQCWARPRSTHADAVVMGVPDDAAPFVAAEAQMAAGTLAGSRLLLGPAATRAQLERHGRRARVVHLATHGHFRQDNPLFSSIRLGDGPLSLFDVYGLDVGADLVTLSGCGTGLSVLAGGDELLGLVRGWLHAGARAVLVTLWDVHDRSTAALMGQFYRELAARGGDEARALQAAMRHQRLESPHPYYWAPFVLIGGGGHARRDGRVAPDATKRRLRR